MHHLTHTASRDFPAPPDAVYSAILHQNTTPADRSAFGAFLSITPVWGTLGSVGYQTLFRCNWSLVDLEMTEITLAATPPSLLRVSQRPQRFLLYKPTERLPPVGDMPPTNLEKAFASGFGSPPPTTEIQFDLRPSEIGTDLRLSIDLRMMEKPGWLKRRWAKQIPRQVPAIFANITAALG